MTEQQQYPTREQIAEALRCVYDEAAAVDDHARRVPFDIDYTAADAVLALFPQPTPSAEPRMTCDEPRPHDAHEGETGFGDEPDIDWVHWKCPGVSLATPPSIADMAPGSTFTAAGLPAERGGYRPEGWELERRWFVFGSGKAVRVVSDSGWPYQPEGIDPSTIRDVTPPPATPGSEQ